MAQAIQEILDDKAASDFSDSASAPAFNLIASRDRPTAYRGCQENIY
jgi:hypothetical protein